MLKRFKSEEAKKLDEQIDSVLSSMSTYGPDEPEYAKLLSYLKQLNKLKAKDSPRRVSRDTLVMAFVNLVGIGIIVLAEREHVVNSKALNFIPKMKS